MSFTSNYSFSNLIKQLTNYEFLNDSSSTSTRNLSLSLCIDVDFNRLDLQAEVFASNFIQHGYIEFTRIFRCNDDQVLDYLNKLYIYSFVKALHNGLYFKDINIDTKQGLCLRGHAAFYQMLRNPNLYKNEGDYSVYALLQIPSDIEKKILMSLILKKYPFLADGISNMDSSGNTPFICVKWESLFNRINDNRFIRGEIKNKESGVNDDEVKSRDIKNEPKNSEGRLILLELNNSTASSIIADTNNPITNVLLEPGGDTLYFTPVNGKNYKIENNPSFFFNLANFIRLDSSDDNDLSKFYHTDRYDFDEKRFFIPSEVFTNTGIKCRIVHKRNLRGSVPKLPAIKDILDRISGNSKIDIDSIIKVIDIIINEYSDKTSSK